jgi:glucose uptake protein GlcU
LKVNAQGPTITIPTPSSGFTGDFGTLLNFLITWAIILGAIAALVMILIGGFSYITAQDDADKAEGGRKTITNGVIGLVIVASAFVIWRLVIALLNIEVFGG